MKQVFINILFLVSTILLFAQKDSIHSIDEIKIYSNFSKKDQVGYSITVINDSLLERYTYNFSQLLAKTSGIYLKQQGNGMVSSIAMRGTGASHTGVYWNGIAINSNLNGQTDFNTINPSNFNSISIRKGGGSVLLGSGAIGGAISLNNNLAFINKTNTYLSVGLGSYNTLKGVATLQHSTSNFVIHAGFGGIKSENDYPYLHTNLKNDNGAIANYSLNFGIGYKFNQKHRFFYKNWIRQSDRNTSRTLSSSNNANLNYLQVNHLLEWEHRSNTMSNSLSLAYIVEDYHYIFDKNYSDFSDNQSKRWIGKYTSTYQLSNLFKILGGISVESILGTGTDIGETKQKQAALFLGFTGKNISKTSYQAIIRKELSDTYTIPILFSLSAKIQWNKTFSSGVNLSSNFKSPTLNDLYWQPGGNAELRPEKSKNIEINSNFHSKDITIHSALFYGKNTDLIQWQPINSLLWQPFNIQLTTNYGLENRFTYNHLFNKYLINIDISYSYTVSKDLSTTKQLLYIPYHLANFSTTHRYMNYELNYNLLYNGSVYTTTSNTEELPSFWISNIFISKLFLHNKFSLSVAINNLLNKNYQIVANRPMPNRNYTLTIHFNF